MASPNKKALSEGADGQKQISSNELLGGKMENGIISLTKTEFGGLPGHRMGRMMSAS